MDNPKNDVLEATSKYFDENFSRNKLSAGKSFLPANGKVVDKEDLLNLVSSCLDLWLTAGSFMDQFEPALAKFWGMRYSLMVNSGSSANLAAFYALTSPLLKDRRLLPGDEFITPASCFPTTINPALQYGMHPVFVDVDLKIHNVTPELVEKAITPKTKLIMIAHTLGNPFDAEKIAKICKERKIWFVEDCCDALGAKINGKSVGTFGDLATCSFYPAHHITTGEGGAILTDSPVLKKIVESFRDWGRDCYCPPGKENTCGKRYNWQLGSLPKGYDHKYIYTHLGFNLKATDMQAAIGLSQLKKAPGFIKVRQDNFTYLKDAFVSLDGEKYFEFPESIEGAEPSWFGFFITIKNDSGIVRSKLLQILNEKNVGTRLLFAGNIVKQPAYVNIPHRISGNLENSDRVMNDCLYIGLWPGLGKPELDYIARTVVETAQQLSN